MIRKTKLYKNMEYFLGGNKIPPYSIDKILYWWYS